MYFISSKLLNWLTFLKVHGLILKVCFHSILLPNQNIFRIFSLDSTLESNVIQKNREIKKMSRFLQDFLKN